MPNHKSYKKTCKTSEKRRIRNNAVKNRLRTEVKKYLKIINEGISLEEKKAALSVVYSFIQKSCSKGVIHKNAAARKQKQMNSALKKIALGAAA